MRSSPLPLLCAAALLGCAPQPHPADVPLSAEPLLPSLAAMAASAPAPASPPVLAPRPLHFTWVVSTPSAERLGFAAVEILAPSGEPTFHCTHVFDPAHRTPDTPPCTEATGWLREPGVYTLRVGIRPWWKSNVPDLRHTFRVDGSEVGFDTLVEMDTLRVSPLDPFVRRFQFDRVVPAPPEVVLERVATPGGSGRTAYVIRNGSADPLHGFGPQNIIAGRLDVFQDGRWQPYDLGGKGADLSLGDAIPPGGAAIVGEGAVDGVTPFTPGRYCYFVHVVRGNRPEPAPDGGTAGAITEADARDVYELRDEVLVR